MGADMPLPTRMVIWLSEQLIIIAPMTLLAVGGTVFLLRGYHATPQGRRAIDGFLLRLPIIGPVIRKVAVARFCRTLSTLLSSGVPILDGLEITATTAGNAVVEDAVRAARAGIERGETVSAPLRETQVFPSMVGQMINVGEATGALDTMLGKIADFYEEEVETAMSGLLTLIEPAMIAMVGVVVGAIVIAMYLPMFDLISQLSQ
jgi:type IV pilus assembly protein PilC